MRKNVVKNIIKMVATTAMVIGIAATVKVNANAMTIEEFSQFTGLSVETIKSDPAMLAMYEDVKGEDASVWLNGAEPAQASTVTETATATTATAGTAVSHSEMLDLINADRKAYGVGSLTWDADLEAVAKERVVEVMANYLSPEYAAAKKTGTTGAVAHKGMRAGTSENALRVTISGYKTAESANNSWVKSASHHRNRIKAGWTKYAAVSYVDPTTNQEVWVELFANSDFKGASSFDYIRYAKDYPDLAAAFGQNKNALYNHYITYGVYEGRKAYYTDGTLFKK